MAPGSAKRKRPDRQFSHDDAGRPSPHRPENLSMAQRMDRDGGRRGGGGDRGSRRQSRQPGPADGVNAVPVTPRNALSPPAPQPQASQQIGTPGAEISRTSTPIPRSGTPAQPPGEEKPKGPPAPYAYEHLTEEIVGSWQDSGKQSIFDSVKEADEMTVSGILQEVVRSGLDGKLDPAEAGMAVKQVISDYGPADGLDGESLFLSAISLLDDSDTRNPALLMMLAATDIDPEVIRQDLDVPLLASLSLVRSTFARIGIRKTTNLLYRQANFNLLREETEGYAKLLTEYYNVAEEAHRISNPDVAEDAFQRIMALVGAFDLDVGRVLDITLDISANLLVKAYAFFIKFYRCSSWWPDSGNLDNVKWNDDGFSTFPTWATPGPSEEDKDQLAVSKQARDERFWVAVRERGMDAFFELGARRIADYDALLEQLSIEAQPELNSQGQEMTKEKRKRLNENRRYMRETRMLPPSGNSDAAQLLGFKLRFYASPARDAEDVMPDNLIHFTALLIKMGFISLRDLYPHLYPADDRMPEERRRLEKEKAEKEAKEKPGGGPNALAMASALTDDTAPFSRRGDKVGGGGTTPKPKAKDEAESTDLPPPPNQKIALLKALLALGAVPEALYVLGRFPWLVEVDTSLAPYLQRIIRHMLSKVADSVRPMAYRDGFTEGREQLDTTARHDDGLVFTSRTQKLPTKWLGLEEVSEKDGLRYRYYYTEWADNVPICQDLDDVFQLCNTLLGYLGVKIGQDSAIYGTLLRLARNSLGEDGSEANLARWLEMIRRLLVPALSLTKHNQSIADEVYQLLMFYPITTRYNIYAEWFTGKTSRLPDMRVAFEYNRSEVKDVLRRVSNENVKTQSRALGRVSYSSPGVLIMFMINQLESYSNMIPAMVECTKYFSKLAYDVLIWVLINSLSGQGRDRMQADGMLTSPWLQALSQFVASLFRHYSNVNPSPILQYLASELRSGNSTDLEMFEQVLAEMAGIRSDIEFNDAQVQAMAGGEQLQTQVLQQLGDTRHGRKSQAKRLVKALAEPSLTGQMLISIAQERQMYAHHESSKYMPLKVLGNNVDKIQQVFAQYLEVLRTNLKPEEFRAAVPDVVSLIGDFGLQPPIAFAMCRAVMVHQMHEDDEVRKQQLQKRRESQEKPQTNGDVEMQDTDAKPVINGDDSSETNDDKVAVVDGESQGLDAKPSTTPQPYGIPAANELRWHPVLQPIIERLPSVTGDLQDRVSIPFFVMFWTLAQTDVVVFTESYAAEQDRLGKQVNEISRDRSDGSTTARQERERKTKDLKETQQKLQAELKARVIQYQKVSNRLSKQEKEHWFDRSRARDALNKRHLALLQECFVPRAMQSAQDAHYSYLILKMLHDKGTPGFSTLVLINQLLNKQQMAAIIFQCTSLEAQHFGRFLNETLKMLAAWHGKKEDYETQALGGKQKLPGFVIGPMDHSKPEAWNFMDYETFRRMVFNWHNNLEKAFQLCFESGEYMHIRNAIIVLKAIVGVFPQLIFMGKNLLGAAEKVSKEDTRQDLKLMALSLLGPLKSREKQWVMPQAFRLNDPAKDAKPSSRAASARPETPQPGAGTPKLNAAAPDFKPTATGLANGTDRKESVPGIEDGEVEEEKQATAKGVDTEMKDAAAARLEGALKASTPLVKPESESTPAPAPVGPIKDQPRATSNAPTPAPSAPRGQPTVNGAARQEQSRPSSTHPPSSRASQGPPARSESRQDYSNKPLPPPPAARHDGRYPSRSDDRHGRLDRPSDMRHGSREHSPSTRSRPRTPPAAARAPSRDERPHLSREEQWAGSRRDAPASALHSRPQDSRDRDRVNGSMGPPPSQSDRPGYLNSVVSAPAPQPSSRPVSRDAATPQTPSGDQQFRVNTERQRIIEAEEQRLRGTQQPEPIRHRDREVRDERGPSSTQLVDARPNGRLNGPEPPREPQGRRDQPTELAPSGPRKGRLSRDVGQESSYGRLNAPQDAPVGPRPANGPNGRSGRNFTAPQPLVNTGPNAQNMPSPSASRPVESAVFRSQPQPSRDSADRRISGPQLERQQPSNTASLTPADDTSGVHPSRRGILQGAPQPPPIQTNIPPANGGRTALSPTSAPPSGPRGAGGRAPAGAPLGPQGSPIGTAPPSGPASSTERQRSTRQRAAINAQIGANGGPSPRGQDVSFRGASTRQNSFGTSAAAPASAAPPAQPQTRNNGPPAQPESRNEARQDLFQQSRDAEPRDGSGPRRREEESHRSSRHPSRERRPDDEPPRRPPPPGMAERDTRAPRDERQRRDDGREAPSRDRRGPPRVDEGRRAPDMPGAYSGPPQPGYRPGGYEAEDGRRGGRGGGRQEEPRGGRREDERRDGGRGGPSRDDGAIDGRKRRHDDPPFGPDKRRRSGR